MNAANSTAQQLRAPQSRPIISAPGLQVVASPAPSRTFFGTLIICCVIFLTSIILAFSLNTLLVQGAYELKSLKVELDEADAHINTLEGELVGLSSPAKLSENATKLGMKPATEMRYLNLETGTIADSTTKSD